MSNVGNVIRKTVGSASLVEVERFDNIPDDLDEVDSYKSAGKCPYWDAIRFSVDSDTGSEASLKLDCFDLKELITVLQEIDRELG